MVLFIILISCSFFLPGIFDPTGYHGTATIVDISCKVLGIISLIIAVILFLIRTRREKKLYNAIIPWLGGKFNNSTTDHWNHAYQEDEKDKVLVAQIYNILLTTGLQNKNDLVDKMDELNQKMTGVIKEKRYITVKKKRYSLFSLENWMTLISATDKIIGRHS